MLNDYILYNEKFSLSMNSKIYDAYNKQNGNVYFAKIVPIRNTTIPEKEYSILIENEFEAMNFIKNHPHTNIIECIDIIRTNEEIIYILEKAQTDLLEYSSSKSIGYLELRNILVNILSGLNFIHKKMGRVHMDIKPENILIFIDENNETKAKICDFGHSLKIYDYVSVYRLQTTQYICRELVKLLSDRTKQAQVTCGIDMWSFGVMLYRILEGDFPYNGTTIDEFRHEILTKSLYFKNMESMSFRNIITILIGKVSHEISPESISKLI